MMASVYSEQIERLETELRKAQAEAAQWKALVDDKCVIIDRMLRAQHELTQRSDAGAGAINSLIEEKNAAIHRMHEADQEAQAELGQLKAKIADMQARLNEPPQDLEEYAEEYARQIKVCHRKLKTDLRKVADDWRGYAKLKQMGLVDEFVADIDGLLNELGCGDD